MSKTNSYTVQRGDTLSGIARSHGSTVQEIGTLNRLAHYDRLAVGQKLHVPAPEGSTPSIQTKVAKPQPAATQDPTLYMQFVDVLNAPIAGMKVMLEHAGDIFQHVTDSQGRTPPVSASNPKAPVTVSVEKAAGGWKQIAQVVDFSEATYVRLRSPKLQLTSSMRPHDGAPQPTLPAKPVAPGTVIETRSPAGNPVQQVALECPNKDNLKLDPNFKYRDFILAASQRSGLAPQAIAAIMNAEAAKLFTFREEPIIDKKTKKQAIGADGTPRFRRIREVSGEWDTRSASPLSSARGMTQFLDGSWIDQAMTEGSFLNARVKKEGWLLTTSVQVKSGKKTVTKAVPAFRLASGGLVTKAPLARTLSSSPYLIGRASASDANLQALLDLRFEAEYAIHTAVDYGIQNLNALSAAGHQVAGLNDGEKAKIVYLAHHLGLADAKKFINEEISESHAKYLLENQVGVSAAAAKAVPFDDKYVPTHRDWLKVFIEEHITFEKFMCQKISSGPVRGVLEITKAIRIYSGA